MTAHDIAVIGAGPAGIRAATLAAEFGLDTILLDEQPAPGGQIYRAIEQADNARGAILGPDYLAGAGPVATLRGCGARLEAGATVWRIERDGTVVWSRGGTARRTAAKRIILATGAIERALPVPGWTLPGVMTAGAAQILLKQSGMVPERAVLAGCGPLIYLVASQLAAAGAPPLAIVDTATAADLVAAARHLPRALRGWRLLVEGVGLLRTVRRAGIAHHRGCGGIAIEGDGRATGIRFRAGGREHRIACETVLLHQGVVPNIQASMALGLDHEWDAAQRCFRPRLDAFGLSSAASIYVAGDGAGVGGAGAAALRGEMAATHAAMTLGVVEQAAFIRLAGLQRRKLARELAVRPFLDRAYPPAEEVLAPADATIVCRCEEVTAGDVRGLATLGCSGPNQAKAFGRCGMGPCQGRFCGLSVTEILSRATGKTPAETGYIRLRMPVKPVTLGELASLDDGSAVLD